MAKVTASYRCLISCLLVHNETMTFDTSLRLSLEIVTSQDPIMLISRDI